MWQTLTRMADVWHRRRARPDPHAVAAIAGKTVFVVITGGSDGIGLALAQRHAADGQAVLLVARTEERLAAARQTILTAIPQARCEILALDVTTPDAADRIVTALRQHGGYCHTLINSAGIGLAGAFTEQSQADLQRLSDLNIRALTTLTRHLLPQMLARGDGAILNVASVGGYGPGPWQAAYYASKAYVIALTEAVAYETAGRGVRVSVLVPGPVKTAFHARMQGDSGLYLRLLPVAAPARIARAAFWRARLGQRVIAPGLVAPVLLGALRVLPHMLTMPIVAFLLKPRRGR